MSVSQAQMQFDFFLCHLRESLGCEGTHLVSSPPLFAVQDGHLELQSLPPSVREVFGQK